jgi:L-lactate dehydrogenase (cytochrome)
VTEHLDPSLHLGPLLVKESLSSNAPPSAPPSSSAVAPLSTPELQRQLALSLRPPLSEVLSLHDFESIARQVMSSRGWAYYSSGADDETTMRENRSVYGRVWMRPRVMRDVTNVNFETSILGVKSSMPVYITATALGKLGHADGELNLTRAGGKHGVIQMVRLLRLTRLSTALSDSADRYRPLLFCLDSNARLMQFR